MTAGLEWRRVTDVAVLRAWAIAEATSPRSPLGVAVREGRCPAELRDKLLGGRCDDLSEAEWGALERMDSRGREVAW
jgi:hypothetical protein